MARGLGQVRRQNLERDLGAVPQFGVGGEVGRLPHLAHAAVGDQAFEPVAAGLRADFLACHQADLGAGTRHGHVRYRTDLSAGGLRAGALGRRIGRIQDRVLAQVELLTAQQPVFVQRA